MLYEDWRFSVFVQGNDPVKDSEAPTSLSPRFRWSRDVFKFTFSFIKFKNPKLKFKLVQAISPRRALKVGCSRVIAPNNVKPPQMPPLQYSVQKLNRTNKTWIFFNNFLCVFVPMMTKSVQSCKRTALEITKNPQDTIFHDWITHKI